MSAKFCFADAVESMMEFRRSVGLSDRTTKSVAAMFGEYCTENSITIPLLTREVAEGWMRWESGHGRRGLPHKATFLRLLARFINATGGSAYELPVACTPKGNGFSPHIFTDDELSMLFAEIDRYEGSGEDRPARHVFHPVSDDLHVRTSSGRRMPHPDLGRRPCIGKDVHPRCKAAQGEDRRRL